MMYYLRQNENELNDLNRQERFFTNLLSSLTDDSSLFATDIIENEESYILLVNVPGIKKEDIKISFNEEQLTIMATIKKEEAKTKFLRKERYTGNFKRSYYVGKVDQDKIMAKVEDGVLEITLPKANKKEETIIKIN